MPKDMLDALIERLETEGDQYVRSSSGKAPNIRRASSQAWSSMRLVQCALPMALALVLGPARAQAPEHSMDEAPLELPADAPLDLSTPEPDSGKLKGMTPFADRASALDWNGTGQVHSWATSQALRFNFLPTDTSVSFGADISSIDDKWLRTLSAEQKLFGGPFSVTGSVSETATGDLSKSLKAGFKRTW